MTDQAERLRQARIDAGFERAIDASERFGWSKDTYKSNENGNAPFSFKKAKEYAAAYGVRPEWLYDASGPAKAAIRPQALSSAPAAGDPVSLAELRQFLTGKFGMPKLPAPGRGGKLIDRRIPVVGEVAAGLWRETPVKELDDITDWLPMEVQGYERASLRAFKVVGPSMNLYYPEGRFVVTAHPSEAGLREGDHVVIARSKAGLTEITLKEFVREADGRIALWPRSTDPDFQAPVYLNDPDEHAQGGLEIVGVVVGDFGKRPRPPIQYERG